MSRVLKSFGEFLLQENNYKKLFAKQTPGNRIVPPRTGTQDSQHQLRLDAGESHGGKKRIYLQVNSQATNAALKKFKSKNGTDAKLAVADLDENTPEAKQEEAARKIWADMEKAAKANLQ